jgi:polar amino acid transport system substrate-binding protein
MSSTVSAGLLDSDLYAQNNEETFIIGFDSEFPPFGYKDNNGEYTGFDIELAKEVAKRNNWKFIAMPFVDWNTKDTELNGGMIDCIWSEFTINNRENDYTWSKEYFNNQQVFIVRSDSNISSIDDLKGKNVEIQGSSSILNALENDNKTIADSFNKISEIDNYNTAFMDLKAGACDCINC